MREKSTKWWRATAIVAAVTVSLFVAQPATALCLQCDEACFGFFGCPLICVPADAFSGGAANCHVNVYSDGSEECRAWGRCDTFVV